MSNEAIIKHQDREKNQRTEGERSSKMNAMLFSGTGAFSMQQRMAIEKDAGKRERIEATNQLARMRLNIHIEKAKRTDLEKQIEEKARMDAHQKKIDDESSLRKTNLSKA